MNNPRKPTNRINLVVSAIFLAALQPSFSAEPVYDGKAISEWLVAMQADLTDEEEQQVDSSRLAEFRDQKHEKARDAIRRIGTNGLPTLLDLVSVVEKNRRSVARQIQDKEIQGMLRDSNPDFREAVRGMAVDGFAALGTNAEPALPALNKLLHGDPNCQLEVTKAMLNVGPRGFDLSTNVVNNAVDPTRNTVVFALGEYRGGDSKAITKILVSVLHDEDWSNRGNAARFLRGREPELAIPVLIPMLDEYKDDIYTIDGVVHALGSYGPAASNAVPKLLSLYTNAVVNTNRHSGQGSCVIIMAELKAINTNAAGRAEEFLVNSGPLNYARVNYTETKLKNGMELIAGGVINTEILIVTNDILATAQLLDPKTGKWVETGKMNYARFGHRATLLPNGQVLVEGGNGKPLIPGQFPPDLSSKELYDPATGSWTVVTNK